MDARAMKEAEAWFARRLGQHGVAQAEFDAWLQAAPAHADAWQKTQALWDRLGVAARDESLSDLVDEALSPAHVTAVTSECRSAENGLGTAPRRASRWRYGYFLAAAAILIAIATIFGFSFASYHTYKAGSKGREIRLADGSQVHLDIGTSLQANIGWWHRNVRLLGGRAVFDVVHDASRPFVVDAGVGRVTVLGTRFQVDRGTDQLSVTLVRGSVLIDSSNDKVHVHLRPGEQARWQASTNRWSESSIDAVAITSWAKGFHVFDATPLAQAIVQINRYSQRKIRLADASLGKLKLSGSFRLGDATAISKALPYVLPVKVREQGSQIVVSRR